MLIIDIEKLNETIEKQDKKLNVLEIDNGNLKKEIDNFKFLNNELLDTMK